MYFQFQMGWTMDDIGNIYVISNKAGRSIIGTSEKKDIIFFWTQVRTYILVTNVCVIHCI